MLPLLSLDYQGIQHKKGIFKASESFNFHEVNKMQTYDTTGANHPAHSYQPNQSNQITFVVVFLLALFLAYAVNQHLITDAFSYCMAQLFQHFSISGGSIYADIFLLIAFLLMLFGLFCLFKFFFVATVSVMIIAVLAAVFFAPETDQPHEVKIKSGEKFERVYGG